MKNNQLPSPFQSIVLLFSFTLTSCYERQLYTTQAHNVPLHSEQGQLKIVPSMGRSYSDYTGNSHLSLESSYSFNEFLAAQINFSKAELTSSNSYGNLNKLNGLIGVYKALDEHLRFEGYLGIGYVSNNYSRSIGCAYTYGNNEYIMQFNLGRAGKHFECAFSAKYIASHFRNNIDSVRTDYMQKEEISLLKKYPIQSYIEPGLTLRGGWRGVKIDLQALYIFRPQQIPIKFDRIHFNIGMQFSLNTKKILNNHKAI